MISDKFVGTWFLKEWTLLVDGEPTSIWEAHNGKLIYTNEGHVSVILMDPLRRKFEVPVLSKGTIQEKTEAIDGYISYAGTYNADNENVYHVVEFSLLPNWIGTVQTRQYKFNDDQSELTLTTPIEIIKDREFIHVLTWGRK